jgi:L-fuconolactonase
MIPVLDSHVHLWSLNDGESHPIRGKIHALWRDFSEEDLATLQDGCGGRGAIVIQAMHTATETERLLRQAEGSSRLLGVVGWADPLDPALPDLIQRYRRFARFVGVRAAPADAFSSDWLDHPQSARAFRWFEANHCPVDILQRVENLPRARAFLRRFPGLRVVLNHAGRPAVMAGFDTSWQREMQAFARETTVTVKCSGLVERAGIEWSSDTIKPWVAALLEAFGTKRVMFATNWPVMTIGANYSLWVRTLQSILEELGLDEVERHDIMGGNAATAYRVAWPPTASTLSPDPARPGGAQALQND